MIKVKKFHNGLWHGAIRKDVWCVPDASAHLFSVKTASQNGYSTTFHEKEIVIRRGDVTIAASGKLVNDLYVLAIRVYSTTRCRGPPGNASGNIASMA